MKRPIPAVLAIVAIAAVLGGCAKGFESSKKVDDLTITLTVAKYPLVKSDNVVNVKVADAAGAAVTGAEVAVRYYMPPMPGMAPMDYKTQAVASGGGYAVTANIPMEGVWKVEVTVTRPGKPSATALFNLDAR